MERSHWGTDIVRAHVCVCVHAFIYLESSFLEEDGLVLSMQSQNQMKTNWMCKRVEALCFSLCHSQICSSLRPRGKLNRKTQDTLVVFVGRHATTLCFVALRDPQQQKYVKTILILTHISWALTLSTLSSCPELYSSFI